MSVGVVVTDEADIAKRVVGPTAWLVLEHLVLTADGGLESTATARSVAEAVSVSKDTAAASIRRLEAAGLVERRRQGRDGGRFASAGLRLSLPAGITVSQPPMPTPPEPARTGSSRRTATPAPTRRGEQLSLIPEPADPTNSPPSPDRGVRHEFASSDASLEREREREHEGGASC